MDLRNLPSFLLGQFNTFSMSAPNPLVQEKWFVNGTCRTPGRRLRA